jgi:hypothetical protein
MSVIFYTTFGWAAHIGWSNEQHTDNVKEDVNYKKVSNEMYTIISSTLNEFNQNKKKPVRFTILKAVPIAVFFRL